MKRLTTIIVLSAGLISGPAMAGHEGQGLLNKENVGGAVGAAIGGFVANKIVDGKGQSAATAAGAVGGFLLGRNVAHNYTGRGQTQYRQSYSQKPGYGYDSRRSYKPSLHPINETFVARTTSNVRSGPGTRYRIVDRLHYRERVHVVGKVKGRDWFMVRTGHQQGFVYAPLLQSDRHGYRSQKRSYKRHGGYDSRHQRGSWYR